MRAFLWPNYILIDVNSHHFKNMHKFESYRRHCNFYFTDEREGILDEKMSSLGADLVQHSALAAPPGISRQQLINRYSYNAANTKFCTHM
jgi:hypothetical protein